MTAAKREHSSASTGMSLTSRSAKNSKYANATAIQNAGSTPIWRSSPLLTSSSPVVSTENVGVRSVNVTSGVGTSPGVEAGKRVKDVVARMGRVGVRYDNAREKRVLGELGTMAGTGRYNVGYKLKRMMLPRELIACSLALSSRGEGIGTIFEEDGDGAGGVGG